MAEQMDLLLRLATDWMTGDQDEVIAEAVGLRPSQAAAVALWIVVLFRRTFPDRDPDKAIRSATDFVEALEEKGV